MPVMPISPAVEAEVAALYPHATNAELVLAFRLCARQVRHIAVRHGLLKTHETLSRARRDRSPVSGATLMQRVAAAAAATGATGLTKAAALATLPGLQPSQVERALHKLTADGRLHRAGRKGSARWFTQRTDAAAFAALVNAPVKRSAAPAPATVPGVRIGHMPGPAQQPGDPQVDEHTPITIGKPVPGPDARWHAGAPRHFAGRIGRYDDDAPPSRWVAAVTGSKRP